MTDSFPSIKKPKQEFEEPDYDYLDGGDFESEGPQHGEYILGTLLVRVVAARDLEVRNRNTVFFCVSISSQFQVFHTFLWSIDSHAKEIREMCLVDEH